MGSTAHATVRTAALRARPSTPPRPPQCRRNASPTGRATVVAEAVRPIAHRGGARRSPRARAQRRANPILRARAATSFAAHDRGKLPARGRMQWCDAACTRKQRRASFDDARSSGELHDWGMPCALTPAWHRRLAGGAEAVRSVAAGSCLSSIIPRCPRRTQRSSHAAAQAYPNGKGLARTEPSTKAAVPPACRYAYARMRTPRWQMRCSARKQLRGVCHAESVGGGASIAREAKPQRPIVRRRGAL